MCIYARERSDIYVPLLACVVCAAAVSLRPRRTSCLYERKRVAVCVPVFIYMYVQESNRDSRELCPLFIVSLARARASISKRERCVEVRRLGGLQKRGCCGPSFGNHFFFFFILFFWFELWG